MPDKRIPTVATRYYVAASLALAALVIFAGLPNSTRFLHVLHKTGHPLAFGAMALMALAIFRARQATPVAQWWLPYLGALAVAIVVGALTEIAQQFTHRGSSLADVLSDALGATACLAIHAAVYGGVLQRPVWQKRGLVLVGLLAAFAALAPLATCIAAYAWRDTHFPGIIQSGNRLDLYFISRDVHNVERSPLPSRWAHTQGEMALRVAIDAGEYPAMHMTEPSPQWADYRSLALDLTNPGKSDLELVVRVHDRLHNYRYDDRFNRPVQIPAESRLTVTLPLQEVAKGPRHRALDLRNVADISVFAARPVANGVFFVSRIWLQ